MKINGCENIVHYISCPVAIQSEEFTVASRTVSLDITGDDIAEMKGKYL